MKKTILIIVNLFSFLFYRDTLAWDNEVTHKDLSEIAAESSVLSKTKGDYLKSLGVSNELEEYFQWGSDHKKVRNWLREGAFLEDAGSNWQYFRGTARSFNHFHNPLRKWDSAGLDDSLTLSTSFPPYTITKYFIGESALKWAQDSAYQQTYSVDKGLEGDQTWQAIRVYYYNALTGNTELQRQENFARTFKGLGHQMHLVQDMSVPAHVRNDAHPEDSLLERRFYAMGDLYFETWAKKNADKIKAFAKAPKFPQVDLSKSVGSYIPISQFYDADQYMGGILPNTSPTWGLSEYTNANFFSTDTIFTDTVSKDDRHYFPYPSYDSQCYQIVDAVDIANTKTTRYLTKSCQGETVFRFAAACSMFKYLGFNQTLQRTCLKLDEGSHSDYAQKLIPRAVGYSAGLLNYFFRGDIRLGYETGDKPGYIITNYTGERMEGRFTLYYDNTADKRNPLWVGDGFLEATMGDKTSTFDFIPPSDAKEPGKYIVVFKGKMGNEEGAVAGYVLNRRLEISPPDQYVYSMIDASQSATYFRNIKAKVRNASPSEAMKNGVIQAVAKYKADINDDDFIYSVSETIAIAALSSTSSTEVQFDFSNDPIPVDVTDLYLEVIFKGTIGNESNAVAIGLKDISEPTPVDFFNNTDLACINGAWYTAGSPEAIAQVDKNGNKVADEWDIYPHGIRNIYIRFSSPDNPLMASPTEHHFFVPALDPGQFLRAAYILTDYKYNGSFYQSWVRKDDTDPWRDGDTVALWLDSAVRNQTDYATDPAICGTDQLCFITKQSSYFPYRNFEIWWGGGLIYVDSNYPPGSPTCPGLIVREQ